jgi:hypothetical protein
MRAERRLGEMMAEQIKTVGANRGERGQFKPKTGGVSETPPAPPTLAAAGIDKNLAKYTKCPTSNCLTNSARNIQARTDTRHFNLDREGLSTSRNQGGLDEG